MNLKLEDIFMFAYDVIITKIIFKRRDFKILEIRNNEVRGK